MEPPSSPRVSVIDDSGIQAPLELLETAVAAALLRHNLAGEVCVLLCENQHIQTLNRQFRAKDEPTDVLTFPSGEDDPLGDIAIAVPYARVQATVRGVKLDQELAYLAIHGALHLCGWDDESDEDRDAMLREMNEVAASVGIPQDWSWGSLLHTEVAP